MISEKIMLSGENVSLTTYLLDCSPELSNANVRPAVLICPGGAYSFCSDREGEPVALAFLAEGYHAFVLRYSLKQKAAFPAPLHDAEEALSLIRANAAAWRVDPDKIAVCGFSAGGHLAASLAVMGSVRPNAAILCYPVIAGWKSSFLEEPFPQVQKAVSAPMPDVFLFTTSDDETVPVSHSLSFMNALNAAGLHFESHIFRGGKHGMSLGRPCTSNGYAFYQNPAVAQWFPLCLTWLTGLGWGFENYR